MGCHYSFVLKLAACFLFLLFGVVYIIWSPIGSFIFLFLLFRVVFIILPTIGIVSFCSCFLELFLKFGPHLAAHSFLFLLFGVVSIVWTLVVFVLHVRVRVIFIIFAPVGGIFFFFMVTI